MRHRFFEIVNFKGINHIKLDFSSRPQSNVHTLVGLNESGKTTVLEALNFFSYKPESLDPLHLPGYSIKDVHELIPISKRANFNESISITAGYSLDEQDKDAIDKFLKDKLDFTLSRRFDHFHIIQSYKFSDSKLIAPKANNVWHINFFGKKRRAKKERRLEGPEWNRAVDFVRTLLPSVLYFPNFLFEFPDKIYLSDTPIDQAKHEFYRTILQDVLDAIDKGTTLEKHVLERAMDGTLHQRRALESVLLKMGNNISSTIFKNWDKIFKKALSTKEIIVSCDQDLTEEPWYLQLRLRENNDIYTISERSLGFRWFFAFILLTQYRGFRRNAANNVLFLFDEPASNLHPSAQQQLLDSFGKFPGNSSIIYTTHSHHMINPEWLESTYVVRNEGLDYDRSDSYNARNTAITLQRYREFATQHPDQTTYFQPILDVLEYSPAKLENVPNVVMVEGKNDFYTLKYFQEIVLKGKAKINLLPGNGAGSLDTVIQLYLAWGRNFIVLLDSDQTGTNQKKRYEQSFGPLASGKIFLLQDIDSTWKGKGLESLIPENDRIILQKASYPESDIFNKTHFNRAIQELYLTKKIPQIAASTIDTLERILQFSQRQLSS